MINREEMNEHERAHTLKSSIEHTLNKPTSTQEERDYVTNSLLNEVSIQPVTMKGKYIVPQMGKSYTKYAETDLNLELLKRGEREVLRFQATVNGHLTEETYELIRTNRLTPDTLADLNPKLSKLSAEPKYIFLKRRYYLDVHGLIHDHLRNDRVVCEPIYVFDMIMGCHLMNKHGSYKGVFQSLADFYSNITRDLVNKAIQFCSICNPEEKIERLEKYKHRNIYKSIMPLERIHIEVFEPFENEKIEGKYSHILFARDYHSRYVWIAPLKNTKFKKLVSAIANFILQLVRQPIFIETTSLDSQDMFDICEQIAEKYQMQLGLGTRNPNGFQAAGIRQMKRKFRAHKTECLEDWNMCLKYGPILHNRIFSDRAGGVPSDLLCSEIHEIGQKFKDKVDQILQESGTQSAVKFGNGLLYLEVSEGGDKECEEGEHELDSEEDEEEEDEEPEHEANEENTIIESNDDANTLVNDSTAISLSEINNTKSKRAGDDSVSKQSNTKKSKVNYTPDEGISMEI